MRNFLHPLTKIECVAAEEVQHFFYKIEYYSPYVKAQVFTIVNKSRSHHSIIGPQAFGRLRPVSSLLGLISQSLPKNS